jgi:hypothetical protein
MARPTDNERVPAAHATYAAKIFELLERYTPEQRAQVMYEIESRWCWGCGHPYDNPDCDCGGNGGATD